MSFDLPASVEREVEEYAAAEHISPSEAAVRLIQFSLKARKRADVEENLVSDEQIRQLKELNGTFGLLEDVPEEQIDRMLATIVEMKQEGIPVRG